MQSKPRCANCEIVIRWEPTVVDGRVYCCLGCLHGGPCECDYDNLPPRDEFQAMVLHEEHVLVVRKAG